MITKYDGSGTLGMSSDACQTFKVKCVECEITYESSNYEDARNFTEKHTEHTGHDVEWVQADIEKTIALGTEWVLTCSICNTDWCFETEELAQEFAAEHAEYTTHEITATPDKQAKELPEIEKSTERDVVKDFIADLEDHYESGVPVGIILALLSEGPTTIADVQHKLHGLKRTGDVYEPRDGYLRVVL